ncbi:hypothetical protein I3842_05G165600 [Carya illinoinensis]|uniref:Uncharacterized protein n=1 Tax=Carya illinoinensis TaxID=32201 RepID=A0A922F086_CARIL|nr:hypothetical protein I3842_05G165600 [Carya illinoinensis]
MKIVVGELLNIEARKKQGTYLLYFLSLSWVFFSMKP